MDSAYQPAEGEAWSIFWDDIDEDQRFERILRLYAGLNFPISVSPEKLAEIKASGHDRRKVRIPRTHVLYAFGPQNKRSWNYAARVPEEGVAEYMKGNQLNPAWYSRDEQAVDMYVYEFELQRSVVALASKIAVLPGLEAYPVQKIQYWLPVDFTHFAAFTRPPERIGSLNDNP